MEHEPQVTSENQELDPELLVAGDVSFDEQRDVEESTLTIERAQLPAMIEALLFSQAEPVSVERIEALCPFPAEEIQAALGELKTRCDQASSGVDLIEVSGGYQLRTKAEFSPFVRELRTVRQRRLSLAALETLAIVAYRQPIVRSDVEAIRGVDAGPTLKTLLDRRLIKIVGHQQTVGQPALYGTTDEFLKLFGLRSLAELPTLRDLQELNREPGEPEERLAAQVEVTAADDDHPAQTEPNEPVE